MAFFGWSLKIALVLASIGLLACGSVKNGPGDDDAGGDFTITADPTSLTVPIAGSQTVTLTI